MDEVYTSTLNSMTGNIYLKDAIIHCDEPLLVPYEQTKPSWHNSIHATGCKFILENEKCCIEFM